MEGPIENGARCGKPCNLLGSTATGQWALGWLTQLSRFAQIVLDRAAREPKLGDHIVSNMGRSAEPLMVSRFLQEAQPFSRSVDLGVEGCTARSGVLDASHECPDVAGHRTVAVVRLGGKLAFGGLDERDQSGARIEARRAVRH